jgi:hypothetical protein
MLSMDFCLDGIERRSKGGSAHDEKAELYPSIPLQRIGGSLPASPKLPGLAEPVIRLRLKRSATVIIV